jgi:predicted lactoylglutathione lyase
MKRLLGFVTFFISLLLVGCSMETEIMKDNLKKTNMNRIHIITLGVHDINKSLRFYRDVLGFKTSVKEESPKIVFFQSQGAILALYPKDLLAEDINKENPPRVDRFSGITLAYNTQSEKEVNEIIEKVKENGGKIEKKPQRVSWGGYSGYFSDPDGHYWEITFWEKWNFREDGSLIIK